MTQPHAPSPVPPAANAPSGSGSGNQTPDGQKQEVSPEHGDLRVGYQVATGLYMQENTITWSRFNIMLTANSLIVSAIGLVTREAPPSVPSALSVPSIFNSFLLPCVGLPLCLLWFLMMARGFTYHNHWRNCALRFERDLFKSNVRPLQEAELLRYPEHAAAEAARKGMPPPRQAGFGLKAKNSAYAVIAMFAIFYLAIVIYQTWHSMRGSAG